ncbi:MAG TPA: YdeI/OmpD-associated family protein [Verrucomicrobiae bacterium]|nr:YdeI/OmpD-associated family protein [Verrucomicrobiae bacterium]
MHVQILSYEEKMKHPCLSPSAGKSSPLRFRSVIQINNVNPYVLVTAAHASRLKPGWRKPLPVCIRVNGHPKAPWHINLMPMGDGNFYLYLHGNVRKASQTKVGDSVTIEVRFDNQYRIGPTHPIPVQFAAALKKNPRIRKNWDVLSPSRQKEILRYFASLKSLEAKERNIKRALHVLSGGKARFMARSWNENLD